MKELWDERFSGDAYVYGTQPNPQFKEFIDRQPIGHILLPGEGEGRNAVYAATLGHKVTAIDQSTVAKGKALQLARHHNVHIDYLNIDLFDNQFTVPSYHVVALSFLHLPPDIRTRYHSFIAQALLPKGKLFVVGFSVDQLKHTSGGPKDPSWLYTVQMLEHEFADLEINHCQQIDYMIDEGDGHKGPASLIVFEATNR